MADTNTEITTYNANITVGFLDATARTYTFKDITEDAYEQAGNKARALNANIPASFKQTFVSNSGAEATQISKVTLEERTEEVIYSAD